MERIWEFGTICFMYVSSSFQFLVFSGQFQLSEPGFTGLQDFQDRRYVCQYSLAKVSSQSLTKEYIRTNS